LLRIEEIRIGKEKHFGVFFVFLPTTNYQLPTLNDQLPTVFL
jgi:hypothetical protein